MKLKSGVSSSSALLSFIKAISSASPALSISFATHVRSYMLLLSVFRPNTFVQLNQAFIVIHCFQCDNSSGAEFFLTTLYNLRCGHILLDESLDQELWLLTNRPSVKSHHKESNVILSFYVWCLPLTSFSCQCFHHHSGCQMTCYKRFASWQLTV